MANSADHDTWGTLRTRHAASGGLGDREDYWLTLDPETDGATAKAYAHTPETTYCPIRFQGQWEDAETGMFYNRFRYYEPMAGQFLCLDPIRLLGGERPISYASNPIKYVDPTGLVVESYYKMIGETLCIATNSPSRPLSAAAQDEMRTIAGRWNEAIIGRGGRMTAGPLTADQRRVQAAWRQRFRNANRCCGAVRGT